jgi:magnesium chelatase family protein
MHFAKVSSAQVVGLDARHIVVEVDITRGLHAFTIVGLAAKAVDESRDRIGAAIKNSGFRSPKHTNQKVTVSLAPAELKKEGAGFDLAIAIAYLCACNVITTDVSQFLFIGELSLDGFVRPLRGCSAITRFAARENYAAMFVPAENAEEAALEQGITVYGVSTLREVIDHLNGVARLSPQPPTIIKSTATTAAAHLDSIVGHETAKRALEIAAAGKHTLALYGPPGTGKTMLANALVSLLPPLNQQEIRDISAIHSIAGKTQGLITQPPFRSPHHRTSAAAIIGGGSTPRPGEVTLAHGGVLFLDEFPEFARDVIEGLRQPLEEKVVRITRQREQVTFPADCIVVLAFNPCPCGYCGHPTKRCSCTNAQIVQYKKKLSGPIIDRIDLWVEVPHVAQKLLLIQGTQPKIGSSAAERVRQARLVPKDALLLSTVAKQTLVTAAERLDLSPRGVQRTLNVARTIAVLAQKTEIAPEHVLEAIQYRQK